MEDINKIAVICGGSSPEREVSINSGNGVKDALLQLGFKSDLIDYSDIQDFNDYKTSFLMAFNFKVNEKFSISLQYDIAYDSEPILNAVEDDQGLSTKFSYSFN